MTIVCPNCDARFRDPPAEVSPDRPVQCSNCEHEWVRRAETGKPRQFVTPPPLEPTMQSLLDDEENAIHINLPVVVDHPNVEATDATTGSDLTKMSRQPIYVDRDPDFGPVKKRSLLPYATLACLGLLAGSISLKEMVVETLPQAHSVYQAAGLTSPAPGLEIGKVETSRSTKDGIRQLIIRGEIENIASNSIPVPPLKLTMRGESNVRLYAWTVSAAKDTLKAGERSRFTAVAHDYPGDAVDVEVEFMPLKK